MEKFYKHHLKRLNEKIEDIYTIDKPEGYAGNEKKVNVLQKLEEAKAIKRIYSVIETHGVSEGETYEEYMNWLGNVENAISILEKEKNNIEQEYKSEIKNIKLLIGRFQKALEDNE